MSMRFEPFRVFDGLAQDWLRERQVGQVPVDAYRHGHEFKVRLDLPGVDRGSIDLTVERDILTVRASRRSPPGDDGEILIAERIQGNFSRRLILGESLDGDRVSSVYSDGVLTIVISVIEQAKPKAETSQSGRVAEPVGAAAVTK